jgi:hypothetical protein
MPEGYDISAQHYPEQKIENTPESDIFKIRQLEAMQDKANETVKHQKKIGHEPESVSSVTQAFPDETAHEA